MNNAKIWILITGIVVLVSGFLLYSTLRSSAADKTNFIIKIQELTSRLTELDRVKADLEQAQKEKAELEAKSQSEIAALEAQMADSKRNESQLKTKLDALLKEKEGLSQYMENNTAIIAKLNKKIESLERERARTLEDSKRGSDVSSFSYIDPINETPSTTTDYAMPPSQVMGAKLAEEEIVDLGRIIVHTSTHEAARVEHVNPLYGFVVLSAGTNDGLSKDAVVNITRNNRLIAKAVIKKVREDAASAVTLPEWTREEIRVGDLVSINAPSPLPVP